MAFDPTKFGLKESSGQPGGTASPLAALSQQTPEAPAQPAGQAPLVKGDENLLVKIASALGMKPLGESIGRGLFKLTSESRDLNKLVEEGKVGGREEVLGKAPTAKQVIGSGLQTAALATPIGAAKTLAGRAAQFAATGAAQGLGSALEQEKTPGESLKQTALTSIISAAFPVVGRGISVAAKKSATPIAEISTNLLSQLTGKEPEVIKRAFSNPQAVAQAMSGKVVPTQIRDEAISVLKTAGNQARGTFDDTLDALQKTFPVKKGAMFLELADGTKKSIDNITAPEVIQSKIGNIGSKVASSVRDFRISISGSGRLNFDKMTSAITSPSEKKQIQEAVSLVLDQKDFTPKGMQAVAERLGNLRKFTEGAASKSSAVITKIAREYGKAIKNVYPELSTLRSEYSIYKNMEAALKPLLRPKGTTPDAITSSITKLQTIFKENNIAYLRALQQLEQKSGKDFLSQIAGSQLKSFAAGSYGSRIAEGSLIAGGIFVNPLLLAVIPLFSPRVVGTGAALLGKLSQAGQQIAPKAAELSSKTADLRRVGLVELTKQLIK